MTAKKPTIAIINSNEDIIEALQLLLTEDGYPTVSGHVISFKRGEMDFIEFVKNNKPEVILFDLAPPYDKNWNFFKIIRDLKEVEDINFVLTTTNKARLKELTGQTCPLEIVGKPYDLKEIVGAIKDAVKSKT